MSVPRTAAPRCRSLILVLAGTALLALSGCAQFPEREATLPAETTAAHSVAAALEAQLGEWRGTPYRYGGLSRKGVDCSGFVYRTFRQRFGIPAPRTTRALASWGDRVPRDRLQAGDLVFFHTGKRHVGIYVEDGDFIHASTSHGVTRSSLRNRYWRRHFWMARRPPVEWPVVLGAGDGAN